MFITLNFPLSTDFAASHKFWYDVFLFSFASRYFLISLLISSLTQCLFSSVLFHFHILFKYILLIMLLQFSQFSSFNPLCPAPSNPPAFLPFSSCSWVLHISSLTSLFPVPFLTSPHLFYAYQLCFLFPVPFPTYSPPSPPH